MERPPLKCAYCTSLINDGDVKCGNCGAPVIADGAPLPDFRTCPYCDRKLLALGSPACNYCGRRLPDDYIKARDADLKRLNEIRDSGESNDLGQKIDELIRQSSRPNHIESRTAISDVASLLDLLS